MHSPLYSAVASSKLVHIVRFDCVHGIVKIWLATSYSPMQEKEKKSSKSVCAFDVGGYRRRSLCICHTWSWKQNIEKASKFYLTSLENHFPLCKF